MTTTARSLPALRDSGRSSGGACAAIGVAVVCGVFLLVMIFAVGPGAPLYGKLVGHGPNDFFPYAVSVSLRPAGPFTVTWATPEAGG